MELLSYFKQFLSNIEPTANQKIDASTGHTTLRLRLEKDDEYKSYFQDSFLSGSYGRDTAIRPIKDVDIIIIANYSEAWKPDVALWHLKNTLSKYYQGKLTPQDRSINVSLSYIEMDIVPAFKTLTVLLKITDKSVQNWVITNPSMHMQLSTTMNVKQNMLYKPLVKALKWWRDNRMNDSWKPKSFLFECLVYDFAANSSINSIPQAIEGFFWFTHNKYKTHRETYQASPIIRDIGGTGNDVAKKWTYNEFCKFMDETYLSWSLSYNALKSQSETESIEKWRQLLGESFPLTI